MGINGNGRERPHALNAPDVTRALSTGENRSGRPYNYKLEHQQLPQTARAVYMPPPEGLVRIRDNKRGG